MTTIREPGSGDWVGPFQLMEPLPAGGMANVYLACYQTSREGEPAAVGYAAVKLLKLADVHNEELRERFRREVCFAERVPRFCTAPVLGADPDADPPWVATEYLDGETLRRRLEMRGPLSGADLETFALRTALALAAIHGSGVIHRDIKPSNVLLSPEGPRIIDFGIAREDTEKEPTLTQLQPGTAQFMSPEQVRNEPIITRAVDVFAWGGLVTAAATRRSPFASGESLSPQAVMMAIVHDDPELGDLAEPLRGIVATALAKDPALRPSAAELVWRLSAMGSMPDRDASRERAAPVADPSSATVPEPPASRRWSRRRILVTLGLAGAAASAITVESFRRLSSPTVAGELINVLDGHERRVYAVAVGDLDGAAIAVSTSPFEHAVRVWHLASGEQIRQLDIPEDQGPADDLFRSVAVGTLRGASVAVLGGSLSRPMQVWDLASGEPAGLELTHRGRVYDEAVSSVTTGHWDGGSVLVTGGWDRTARMWDLRDGHQIGSPVGSPFSRLRTPLPLAVGELDGEPIVVLGRSERSGPRAWNPDSGEQVSTPAIDHDNPARSVAVGAVGGQPVVVTGSADAAIRLWELASGEQVGPSLTGHSRPVQAVAVGEVDGSPLAVSGGDDQTVRIWDLERGRQLGPELAGHTGEVRSVAISEVDGNPVAVSGGDQTVRVWRLPSP